jgi:hypothetical protein
MRFLPVLLCVVAIGAGGRAPALAAVVHEAASAIPITWLEKKISVAEAEATYPGVKDDSAARFPDAAKPFGFRHQQWEELKAAMMPGDDIWTFASPPKSWEDLSGRAGVALVRGGVPIMILVTAMN